MGLIAPVGVRPQQPHEPFAHINDCVYDEMVEAIMHGSNPRASVTSRYAAEMGCDFTDVRCLRQYVRMMTRQEAWDERGKEDWIDQWTHKHKVGFYFARAGLPGGEGHYYDDEAGFWLDSKTAVNVRTPPTKVVVPDPPDRPPVDWVVPEDVPAYEFVERDHQDAIPVWLCTTW